MPTRICRHIKSNGLRCGSPALRDQARCYFHHRAHQHTKRYPPADRKILNRFNPGPVGALADPLNAEYFDVPLREPLPIDFPPLEDRESIQLALSMIVIALGRKEMDPAHARTILYALKVASYNAKDLRFNLPDSIRELVIDQTTGDELALDEDAAENQEQPSPASPPPEPIQLKHLQ
jgi:hypothetical protein